MKKIVLLLSFLVFSTFTFAQDTYSINGENLTLKTEVDGTLDLLWNTINGEFRYFVREENGTFTELKNTKGNDGKFKEEYISTLNNLTGMDASKVRLTPNSLKRFLDSYNKQSDPNYNSNNEDSKLSFRLGLFGGLTNSPFVDNPDNETAPFFGAELELLSDKALPSQAGFVNIRHTTESSDFKFSFTEIALGYRYRFINKETFNIYAQNKFATLTFINNNGNSFSDFDAPLVFGVGADIKVGENSYLTLVYDSIFGIVRNNEDNFPIDFAIGYKFNL